MDRTNYQRVDVSNIRAGMELYSSDDRKIGSIDTVTQDYLLTHTGVVFSKDRYIPTTAISRIEADRVYLNVTRDGIDQQSWDAPPTGQTDESGEKTQASESGAWSEHLTGPNPSAETGLPRIGDVADIAETFKRGTQR